jgi:hypothetical protein
MLGAGFFDEELMLLACAEAFVAPVKATKIIDATTAANSAKVTVFFACINCCTYKYY